MKLILSVCAKVVNKIKEGKKNRKDKRLWKCDCEQDEGVPNLICFSIC